MGKPWTAEFELGYFHKQTVDILRERHRKHANDIFKLHRCIGQLNPAVVVEVGCGGIGGMLSVYTAGDDRIAVCRLELLDVACAEQHFIHMSKSDGVCQRRASGVGDVSSTSHRSGDERWRRGAEPIHAGRLLVVALCSRLPVDGVRFWNDSSNGS